MFFNYSDKLCSDRFFIKESDVHAWCKAMGIGYYTYAYSKDCQAMTLRVNGSINLRGKLDQLSQLPVRFERISGNLWLDHNQLTSLEGLPKMCHNDINIISLQNNPLSFEALTPLSYVEELDTIYLPIELKDSIEEKGIQFHENEIFIVIIKQEISNFQSVLRNLEQQMNEKKNLKNKDIQNSLLSLNQSFQQKTLFKGKRHEF